MSLLSSLQDKGCDEGEGSLCLFVERNDGISTNTWDTNSGEGRVRRPHYDRDRSRHVGPRTRGVRVDTSTLISCESTVSPSTFVAPRDLVGTSSR